MVRLAVAVALTSCAQLPVRYEACGLRDAVAYDCKVTARFATDEDCERFRAYTNAACDTASHPGAATCTFGQSVFSTGRCTR